jgi:ribose 1,5-bisphosphate isomerase
VAAAASPLQATVDDIRAMRVRGAAPLAVAAAKALAQHVAGSSGDLEAVRQAARSGAELLLASRPTAMSLRHGIAAVADPVARAGSAEAARHAAAEAGAAFARAVKASEAAIAKHGAEAIRDGERILTHCHSSTVVSILARAHEEGKGIEVYATETRPFRQGLTTTRWLREAGVPTTLVVDGAALRILQTEGVRRVLVGADTVARDGSLFNKVGTSLVALAAHSEGVPFWCAASWIKFSDQAPDAVVVEERDAAEVVPPGEVPPGARVRNPVFDRTPPERITGFVTESGLLPPRQAVEAALHRLSAEGPA